MYVPRDETFEEMKQDTFSAGRLKALLHNLVPSIAASLAKSDIPFNCFSDIDSLYKDGLLLTDEEQKETSSIPFLPSSILNVGQKFLKYDIPAIIRSIYSA